MGHRRVPAALALLVAVVAGMLPGVAAGAAPLPGGVVAFGSTGLAASTAARDGLALPAFGGRRVVAVAAGAAHGLALTEDGGVWSWGANDRGQLGHAGAALDPAATQPVPRQVTLPGPASAVAAGARHSLVVVAGEVYGFRETPRASWGWPWRCPSRRTGFPA